MNSDARRTEELVVATLIALVALATSASRPATVRALPKELSASSSFVSRTPAVPQASPRRERVGDDLASSGEPPRGVGVGDWSDMMRQVQESEYRISQSTAPDTKGRLRAPNRKNNLRTFFEAGGIRVRPRVSETAQGGRHSRAPADPTWEAGLRLASWGPRGQVSEPFTAFEPVTNGNRVEFRRMGLTEWYVNRPEGLEHGFTIEKPTFKTGREIQLNLSVSGGFAVTLDGDGRGATFEKAGIELRYDGLRVLDADRRVLKASMEASQDGRGLEEATFSIVFDTADVSWPVTVDPILSPGRPYCGIPLLRRPG